MNWKDEYESKNVTADEAVKAIKSNSRVVIGHAVGEPCHLVKAMINNKEQYENVEIVHLVPMGSCEYTNHGMEKHFRHNSIFTGSKTRKAIEDGRADFTPCFFYQVPELFKNQLPVDVALIQVSEPDKQGYCSFGVSVDYTKPAAQMASLVIAQVNKNMPRTFGDSFIHVSDINFIVEHTEDLLELPLPKIGDIEKAIGENCAKLVSDGDTLQLGIGAIPDAVLMFLKDKKDLGIHSEMISDGVIDLVETGVITNKRKNFNPGKAVVTFLMGSKRLYSFADNNPMIAMYPVDYVNNPLIAMQNDNLISINSCVQVDLTGQVASESIGHKQISGVGGQVDFVRGASMSRGGKSIIAIASTTSGGKVSKIVNTLDMGAIVTTSRTDVDYIVTEYGIAKLKGKSLRERAKALINIAHPDFREELSNNYHKQFPKCV